jgi:hypothetical protein
VIAPKVGHLRASGQSAPDGRRGSVIRELPTQELESGQISIYSSGLDHLRSQKGRVYGRC